MAEYAVRQTGGVDTATRLRLAEAGLLTPNGTLTARAGVNGLRVTPAAVLMSRTIEPGRASIPGANPLQGSYWYVLDTAKTVTFDPGDSQPRVDLVVARVWQNDIDSSGQTKAEVTIIKGTPGAGAPSVAGLSCVVLFEQPVPANVSAGSGGLGVAGIDRRPTRITTAGGVVVVADETERDALDVYDGLIVYRVNINDHERRKNGAWVPLTEVQQTGRQNGKTTYNPQANTPTSKRVTFPTPYAAGVVPAIQVSLEATVIGGALKGCSYSDVDNTGFTVWVYRTNNIATTVAWSAEKPT